MHLIQILLPLADNAGATFPGDVLEGIQTELSRRFGGLTAYSDIFPPGIYRRRWRSSQVFGGVGQVKSKYSRPEDFTARGSGAFYLVKTWKDVT
jgi:hypothetical protein